MVIIVIIISIVNHLVTEVFKFDLIGVLYPG